jgi:hypothetical protein
VKTTTFAKELFSVKCEMMEFRVDVATKSVEI